MARVFQGQRTFLHPILRWLESLTYKVTGCVRMAEQRWTSTSLRCLSFSISDFCWRTCCTAARLPAFQPTALQRQQCESGPGIQHRAIFSPTPTGSLTVVNRLLVTSCRMAVFTVQNFISAAAGMAVAVAVIRGFARHETRRSVISGSI